MILDKWRVERTKSKRRWVAWRVQQKRKSGRVFDTWREAFVYAAMMHQVDDVMRVLKKITPSSTKLQGL